MEDERMGAIRKNSELEQGTYAKTMGGGGIASQPINLNELVENEFYQFNNNELNTETFQIQVRERKHVQYLYTQNNIAFFRLTNQFGSYNILTPSINDTIFTNSLYKCRCDICNPPNRARSPSVGGRKRLKGVLEQHAEYEMDDLIDENEQLREDVEEVNNALDEEEETFIDSWVGILQMILVILVI